MREDGKGETRGREKERGEEGRKNGSVPWFGLETLITQDHRL